MMEIANLTARLRYAYALYINCKNPFERSWYQGYINCMEMIIKMLKGEKK